VSKQKRIKTASEKNTVCKSMHPQVCAQRHLLQVHTCMRLCAHRDIHPIYRLYVHAFIRKHARRASNIPSNSTHPCMCRCAHKDIHPIYRLQVHACMCRCAYQHTPSNSTHPCICRCVHRDIHPMYRLQIHACMHATLCPTLTRSSAMRFPPQSWLQSPYR